MLWYESKYEFDLFGFCILDEQVVLQLHGGRKVNLIEINSHWSHECTLSNCSSGNVAHIENVIPWPSLQKVV